MEVHKKRSEPWKVTVVDTGEETMTGGRLKRVREYLGNKTSGEPKHGLTHLDGLSGLERVDQDLLHDADASPDQL